ncbi:MAG: hypothetical protein HZA95_01370 [Candidatus Vogelbacteria bacterium]|nr:hypothetical protein [Candidatus Vogelbacteria bacterium]
MAITPPLTDYLYKNKMWKKKARTQALGGGGTPIFNELHKDKEIGTPRMGGVIVWGSVFVTTLIFWLMFAFYPSFVTSKLSFLSRNQTWLLLFSMLAASFVGMVDDLLQTQEKGGYVAGGLSLSKRIGSVIVIGLIGAWWFYVKLGVSAITIPFVGSVALGWLFIPLFVIVMLALFSGGVIDGLDGLSGGVFSVMYASYAVIAFIQQQYDIAAFCAVVVGGLLAFLWYNIPPARFYLTETGTLGLTVTLAVVAFLTDNVPILILIAFPLLIESASVIIQIGSKKVLGKKVFLVAPIHHHFEALGWPATKVVMRFWIVSIISAVAGLAIALIGKV